MKGQFRLGKALLCALTLTLTISLGALAEQPKPGEHQEPTGGIGSTGPAVEPDRCTIDALTKQCTIFDPEKGEKLMLPDGTFIPNFAAILKVNEQKLLASELEKSEGKFNSIHDQAFQISLRLNELLADIPGLHPDFKFYLATRPGRLKFIFEERGDRKLELPWPPERPDRIQLVSASEVKRVLLPYFDPRKTDRMREIIRDNQKAGEERLAAAFSDPNNATVKDMKRLSPERVTRVEQLVEIARTSIIDLIRKGKDLTALSASEASAIAKIRSIRLTPPDDEALTRNTSCAGIIPNAFYDADSHRINICPGFYNAPDAEILGVVAHELGHAIDPCLSQFGVYEVDREKLMALVDPRTDKAIPEITGTDGDKRESRRFNSRFMLFESLRSMIHEAKPTEAVKTGYPMSLGYHPEAVEYFERKGVLKLETPGTPFDSYVFKDAFVCLKSESGGGFRAQDDEEVRHMAREVTRQRAEVRGRNYDRQADEERIVSAFAAHRECVGVNKSSQMGEVMADWVGAKVLGRYLEKERAEGRRLVTDEQRLAPVAFFASLVCMKRIKDAAQPAGNAVGDILSTALRDYNRLFDPHPESSKRIEDVFLRDAGMRSALGCGRLPDGARQCS